MFFLFENTSFIVKEILFLLAPSLNHLNTDFSTTNVELAKSFFTLFVSNHYFSIFFGPSSSGNIEFKQKIIILPARLIEYIYIFIYYKKDRQIKVSGWQYSMLVVQSLIQKNQNFLFECRFSSHDDDYQMRGCKNDEILLSNSKARFSSKQVCSSKSLACK